MVKHLSRAALAVLFLLAGRFVFADDVPGPLQGVHRIVCLGDSITQMGEGKGGYVWLVREYLQAIYPDQHFEVLNAGISGHRSTDMAERYQRDVIDKHPDLVTISVGVNDVWHGFMDNYPKGDGPRGIPLEKYKELVTHMVEDAQAHHAKVVILSATVIGEDLDDPRNKKAEAYNAALRDIARDHHAIYVDYQKVFRAILNDYHRQTGAADLLLTVDGVHMNSSGNRVMANALLQALGVPEARRKEVQGHINEEMRK